MQSYGLGPGPADSPWRNGVGIRREGTSVSFRATRISVRLRIPTGGSGWSDRKTGFRKTGQKFTLV
eukprot:3397249-Rhodomonas_salina.2